MPGLPHHASNYVRTYARLCLRGRCLQTPYVHTYTHAYVRTCVRTHVGMQVSSWSVCVSVLPGFPFCLCTLCSACAYVGVELVLRTRPPQIRVYVYISTHAFGWQMMCSLTVYSPSACTCLFLSSAPAACPHHWRLVPCHGVGDPGAAIARGSGTCARRDWRTRG